jgi:hypothetical protein
MVGLGEASTARLLGGCDPKDFRGVAEATSGQVFAQRRLYYRGQRRTDVLLTIVCFQTGFQVVGYRYCGAPHAFTLSSISPIGALRKWRERRPLPYSVVRCFLIDGREIFRQESSLAAGRHTRVTRISPSGPDLLSIDMQPDPTICLSVDVTTSSFAWQMIARVEMP